MEDVQNTQEQVVMTKEQFDAIMGRLDKLEGNNNAPSTAPVFSGGNGTGLSVPYTPAKKDSGWSTFGKIAIGAGLTGLVWAVCSAIGGSSGSDNTFGGNMPN